MKNDENGNDVKSQAAEVVSGKKTSNMKNEDFTFFFNSNKMLFSFFNLNISHECTTQK